MQIVEEAGGTVSCMDGGNFSVFDRSVLVSNGVLHEKVVLLRLLVEFPFWVDFSCLYSLLSNYQHT